MKAKRLILVSLLVLAAEGGSAGEWVHRETVNEDALTWSLSEAGWIPSFPEALPVAAPGQRNLPGRLLSLDLPAGERLADFQVELSAPRRLEPMGDIAIVPLLSDEAARALPAAQTANGDTKSLRFMGELSGRGRRRAVFLWRPLRYVDNALEITETLTLHWRSEPDPQPPLRPLREGETERGGPFEPRDRPSLDGSPVDAVIVTTAAMAPACQRLADWHLSRGTRTVVRTLDWIEAHYPPGRDRGENIRFFLQDAYQLWGLQAVILGGDTMDVPTRYLFSYFYGSAGVEVPTDTYYSCLDGNWNADGDVRWGEAPFNGEPGDDADIEPELMLGRLPVSTPAQADAFVDKIIAYRDDPQGAFQDKALFLAEVLFPADWVPGEVYWLDGASLAVGAIDSMLNPEMEYEALFENWQDPLYSSYDPRPLSVQAAFDSMNTGHYGFVDQNGHGFRYNMSVGNGSILIQHAQSLDNAAPFHISLMNCSSTAFDFDCLGEAFLRNPQGGAVAVMGTSRDLYPGASYPYQTGYYQRIFQQQKTRPGEVLREVRQEKAPFALEVGAPRWTYFVLLFLGDPLLDLWAGTPRHLDVALAEDPLTVGDQLLHFTVTSGGSPVAGARLTLEKEGEVWSAGLSDAAGACALPARILSPGTLTLTAWAPSAHTLRIDYPVQAGVGPFVYVEDLAVDDNSGVDPVNNDNGALDAGETVRLQLTLRNGGNATAGQVQVDLLSLAPGLTVNQGSESFGDLAAGSAATGSGSLEIAADLDLLDGSLLELRADIAWTGDSRRDTLTLDLRAPKLVLSEWHLTDNNDDIFEEDEVIFAYPRWVNLGGGETGTINASLTSLDPDLIIGFDEVSVPSLGLLEDARPSPGFTLRMANPNIENFAELETSDGFGRSVVTTLEFLRPVPPTGLVADASLAPDRIELSWAPSVSSDVRGYHVYYTQDEQADMSRYTMLPADHEAVVVENLAENSLASFYVTAVDSSGMESVPSDTLTTSTNPAQLGGFPQAMLGSSCTTSPAVGNIAGDSQLELVAASEFLYAWHHNGEEVRDGDNEASTYGVFSVEGGPIAGAVTLIPLLGNQYRQIVIGTKRVTDNGIYIFDDAGNLLPGWPQSTQDWLWVNVLGADMDGDEDLEILALDVDGVVYGFHHDGSELADGDNNPDTHGILKSFVGYWSNASPAAGDLDGDGDDELVIMGTDEMLHALQHDGSELPGFPVDVDPFDSGDFRCRSALCLANLDGDPTGSLEIVFHSIADSLFVYDAQGQRWGNFPLYFRCHIPPMGPAPIPVDLDGDGDLELIVVETVTGSQVYIHAIEHDGTTRPGWPALVTSDTESSPVIGDVDGDGQLEIVLGTNSGIIFGFKEDGSPQPGFPINVGDAVRGTPALADLDGDGDIELLATSLNGRVMVWDFPGAFNEASCPWPTISGNYFRTGYQGFWDQVPVAVSDIRLEWVDGGVNLSWAAADPAALRWGLEREVRDAGGAWSPALLLSDDLPQAGGFVSWRDEAVEPEQSYRYYALAQVLGQEAERIYLGAIDTEAPIYADRILGAYPNPFNPSTTVLFETAQAGPASLEIFSIDGRRLRRLAEGTLEAGRHERVWDGRDAAGRPVASGIYLARLIQPGRSFSQRLVLLK